MTNVFYFFIKFFLVFFNQLSKFLFFCQTILFFTSNECFSHFNVQQLSAHKHKSFCFVFTSSFKNNIEKENIRKNLFHSILLNFGTFYTGTFYTVQYFLERNLKFQKLINKRGVLITAGRGGGGRIFFQKK